MGRIGEFTREAHEAAIGGNNLCLRGIGEPHPSEVKAKKELHARMMEKERVLAKLAADTAARERAARTRRQRAATARRDAFARVRDERKEMLYDAEGKAAWRSFHDVEARHKYRAEISAMRKEDRAQRAAARDAAAAARGERVAGQRAAATRWGLASPRSYAPPAAPPLSPRERPTLCATRRATGGTASATSSLPRGRWRDSPTRSSNAPARVAAGERAAAVGVPCRESAHAAAGERGGGGVARARRRPRKAEKARLAALEGGIYDAAPPLVSPRGRRPPRRRRRTRPTAAGDVADAAVVAAAQLRRDALAVAAERARVEAVKFLIRNYHTRDCIAFAVDESQFVRLRAGGMLRSTRKRRLHTAG